MSKQRFITSPKTPSAANQKCVPSSQELVDDDTLLEDKLTSTPYDDLLSKREKQILEYIIAGHTNKEIAQMLYRTQRTVEYHRNRLMRKLDTHTTAELVKRAILMGIV